MEKYIILTVVIKADLKGNFNRISICLLVVSICKISLRFHFANKAFTKFTRFVVCKDIHNLPIRFGILSMSLEYYSCYLGGLIFTYL